MNLLRINEEGSVDVVATFNNVTEDNNENLVYQLNFNFLRKKSPIFYKWEMNFS